MSNYILEYYQGIKDGTYNVGQWVRAWYEYIIKGLEDGAFFYAPKKAAAVIKFVENFCRHHEGAKARELFKLEVWQKAFLAVVFGVLDESGRRQFREVVLIVARKNGKTLLASAVAEYMTFADGEYGAKIYFCAPKLQQANLCFDAFYQSIIHDPALSALGKKRRSDVYIESTNTSAMPLAYNHKKSDGLNIHLGVADEIASWAGDSGLKFYEVLKSSGGARTQPVLLSISTAGYENEGIYDELIKRATRVLKGDSKEKRLAPFLYMIDDPRKWNDINELAKSNPNLGVSVSVDYLLEEIAVAEGSLSKRAEFITKYCNLKQNSSQAWLSDQVVRDAGGEPLKLEDYAHSYCVGGIDLSRTTDLTACCVAIERKGRLHVFAKFFLPREKLEEATARDNVPYQAYIDRGFLQLSGEHDIDYRDCFAWFRELVEKYEILPLQVGYDRYSATYLVQEMRQYGFHMDDVFQGTNLTPVINEMEAMLKDRRLDIGDNDLLKLHLLDSALKFEGGSDRCRLVKIRKNAHIDGTAALLDALCVRMKYYGDISNQLKNEV